MQSLDYARKLIAFDSTWFRSNATVSDYVESVLKGLDFDTERVEFTDEQGIRKVNVLGRKGAGDRGLAYFGHTDVVPSDNWSIQEHGPFDPTVRDGRLYGRGSTDMKGSVACMLAAAEAIKHERLHHPIYLSCTADEEVDHGGANIITERSDIYRELVANRARGIVGEPTELQVVYAHKGGCRVTVTSHGRSAHSSTRNGLNANLAMIPFLGEMKTLYEETEEQAQWLDPEFDPPSIRLNIGINDHTNATNITAPQSICTLGFRPMPPTDTEAILQRIQEAAERQGLDLVVENRHPAFRRDPESQFAKVCVEFCGGNPPQTVGFGTEASNFAEVEEMIILGPGSIAQAHTSDEWIELDQLRRGESLYRRLLEYYCLA